MKKACVHPLRSSDMTQQAIKTAVLENRYTAEHRLQQQQHSDDGHFHSESYLFGALHEHLLPNHTKENTDI